MTERLAALSYTHVQDADAYAAWGVDYLKYDYCHMQDVTEPPEVCGPLG